MSAVGIFSDVHGNIDALEAVLKTFAARDVDDLYCLGDVVGYGGDPQSCCDLVREHALATVMGNHDAAVAGTMNYDYYYDGARNALDAHREMLNDDVLGWLASLPYTHRADDGRFLLSHGNPASPSEFEYIFETAHVEASMHRIIDPAPVTFIGHSHLTRSFRYRTDEDSPAVEEVTRRTIDLEEGWHYIVTVGSVGQPRDRDARARAVIFDADDGSVEFLHVNYDIAAAADRILENQQLPVAFAKRLFLGV